MRKRKNGEKKWKIKGNNRMASPPVDPAMRLDLSAAISTSIGQSHGHSLDLSGVEEAHRIYSSMD